MMGTSAFVRLLCGKALIVTLVGRYMAFSVWFGTGHYLSPGRGEWEDNRKGDQS